MQAGRVQIYNQPQKRAGGRAVLLAMLLVLVVVGIDFAVTLL